MRVLRVSSPDTSEEVVRIAWDGSIRCWFEPQDPPLLNDEIHGWRQHGLVELRDDGDGLYQRVTPETDPAFLDRLAARLTGEFGFVCAIDEKAR